MARKRKENEEAYERLLRIKERKYRARRPVRCDTSWSWIEEETKKELNKLIGFD